MKLGPHDGLRNKRPRSRLPRLCIRTLVAFAAAGILLELFLRFIVGLGDPPLYQEHQSIEYLMKPGRYRRFGNDVTVNSAGMRAPELAVSPVEIGAQRVLVIGDSVVNGGSLTDDRELSTSLLAERMSKFVPTTVCNVSAGSWGPGNWLAYLRERGTFGARFAILVLNDGDATDAPTFAPLGPEHPTRQPRSACSEFFCNYLPRYLRFGHGSQDGVSESVKQSSDPKEDLVACVELLRNAQVKICAVLFPAEAEVVLGQPGKGRLALETKLRQLDVPFVLADGYFRDAIARGLTPYRDGIHPSVAGQALLVDCYLDALSRVVIPEALPSGAP
jgi:hypothetical protein